MRTVRVKAPSTRTGGLAGVEDQPDEAVSRPGAVGASTLEGKPVVNAAGKNLGHIEKIMLDVRRGQIAYAVLSFGNAFGAGHRIAAVPWSALVLDQERRCFVLDLAMESSEDGRAFDQEECPDPGRHSEIGRYYGA